ncbi:GTPase ObgE, partial [Rhizobiaceae sp. 2RAB30]
AAGRAPFLLSAVTREGIEAVLRALASEIHGAREAEAPTEPDARWQV